MTKQEIWNQLIERYPEWKDETHVVKQRVRGLKALLDQAWDNGFERGKDIDNLMKNLFKK